MIRRMNHRRGWYKRWYCIKMLSPLLQIPHAVSPYDDDREFVLKFSRNGSNWRTVFTEDDESVRVSNTYVTQLHSINLLMNRKKVCIVSWVKDVVY